MSTDHHGKHQSGDHHETHLGVDAWVDTKDAEAAEEGYVSAARILAGEDPEQGSQENDD